MRQLEGRSADVPVVTALSPSVHGLDLTKFADQTTTFGQVRPRTVGLYVSLTGPGTVELVLNARIKTQEDGDLGWAKCSDTGNFGLLFGGPIPSPGTYIFLAEFASIYTELALLAQNNVGGVVVSAAKLIEYAEYHPRPI